MAPNFQKTRKAFLPGGLRVETRSQIEHRPGTGRLHCNADGVSRPSVSNTGGRGGLIPKIPWADELQRADEC